MVGYDGCSPWRRSDGRWIGRGRLAEVALTCWSGLAEPITAAERWRDHDIAGITHGLLEGPHEFWNRNFQSREGFGFIERDAEERDVFVHISVVERVEMNSLAEGQKLSFEIVRDPGRLT